MKIRFLMAFILTLGIFVSLNFDRVNNYLTNLTGEELITYCGIFDGICTTYQGKGFTSRYMYLYTSNSYLKKFKINQYVTKSNRESKVVYFKFDVREGDQICVDTKKMFFRNNLVLNVYKNQS